MCYSWLRSFTSRAQAYLPNAPPPVRAALLRWTIALPYLMRSHLMSYAPGSDSLEALLTADEVRLRWSST